MIYSDEREGVGLSKNRVLKQFPDYDYYFFIEDDVELLNVEIFYNHIQAYLASGYPHFSLTHPRKVKNLEKKGEFTITWAMFGSAHFNFFEGNALRKVGGWHTIFAKFKRYGHTEHSYRFFHLEMQPAPFLVLEKEFENLIFHYPPHVTAELLKTNQNQLIKEEESLISKRLSFYPVETISPFYLKTHEKKDGIVYFKKRYPFSQGKERRNAFSDHYFYKIGKTKSIFKKIMYLILSIANNPFNVPLKHFVKTKLLKNGK